jgi:peptidyl-prolyl cis-trans isomerase B (cyclophilin B)
LTHRPIPPKRKPGTEGGLRPKTTRASSNARVRGGSSSRSGLGTTLVIAAIGIFVVGAALVLSGVVSAPSGTAPSATARGTNCPTAQPAVLAAGETRTVTIDTPKGKIVIKVEGALSPIAAGNFVALASCGFYDGLTFHRLVPGFVIQGGDPKGDGTGDPGYKINDEPVTEPYKRGVVAMARSSAPNSQGSQFFVVLDDSASSALTRTNNYAIFGSVVTGMDVVDTIAAQPNSGAPDNLAMPPIPMTSVTVASP